MENGRKPTSKAALNFWGVSQVGYQLIQNMDTTFFAYFLTDVALFSAGVSGLILTVTSTVDLIYSILVGAFIGMIPPMRWGRLRSYQLILPPLVIIFFTLQFTSFGNGLFAAAFIILAYAIAHICTTTAYTADFAMVQEIAATPGDRVKLNSNRMVGSNLGRLICSYVVPLFTGAVKSIIDENFAYMLIAFAWAIVLTIGYWIHFKMGEGYENQGATVRSDENLKIKDIFKAFTTNINLLAIVISDLASNVGSFVIPALNVYYYKYAVGSMPNVTLKNHLLFSSLFGLAGAYLAGVVGRKVSNKRRILLVSYATVIILLALSRMVALTNAYAFFALQVIMQMVVGFTQPLESDLYMDVAVYHEWKTGKNCTAFIMGLLNIPVKLSQVIKSVVITALLASVGYVANMAATPELVTGIANGYVFAPVIAPAVGLISLGFLFKLRPEQMGKMQAEVNARRASRNEANIEDDIQD